MIEGSVDQKRTGSRWSIRTDVFTLQDKINISDDGDRDLLRFPN